MSGQLVFSDGSTIDVELADATRAKKSTDKNVGLSEIKVFPSPNQYSEPIEWIDPFIETN